MRSPIACHAAARVEVQGDRVDVAEDRRHALVEQAVRRGDEAERRGDDLVALAPAQRPHAEVKRRGARGNRDGVGDPQVVGEGALEALLHRPERQPAGPQHLEHQLLLALADDGLRERDRPLDRVPQLTPARRAERSRRAAGVPRWNAYSSESTSASQDASMMFSETPIEPHESVPSAESSRTRVIGAGAVVGVEDPDLVVDELDVGEMRMQLADRVAQRPVERVDRAVALRRVDVAASVDPDLDRRLGLDAARRRASR